MRVKICLKRTDLVYFYPKKFGSNLNTNIFFFLISSETTITHRDLASQQFTLNMEHIISSDTYPSQDILGRNTFAKQIVNSLTLFFGHHKESLVVGISGKWGSGKSTLLDYVTQHLKHYHQSQQDNYKILSFNSWGHTAGDDLERSFLEKVVGTLSEINWKDKAVKVTANSKNTWNTWTM
ncbi:hypothetical protein EA772_14380 [Pedobacter sp. G11]|uniref:P-loop NTPase fold protein n=1 Tax=Pedobacter sp. G11 TaxID=2482728 RepID=UPI000F5D5094|nr:P-loop NTPase fold protein [Pedobacter sp. G11]AZI26466.1 hypothetical protein EA772_14380 [Pedobacter sp. G11]